MTAFQLVDTQDVATQALAGKFGTFLKERLPEASKEMKELPDFFTVSIPRMKYVIVMTAKGTGICGSFSFNRYIHRAHGLHAQGIKACNGKL